MNEATDGYEGGNPRKSHVMPVPEEALQRIDTDVASAGGEWEEPEEYAGSIARTMFDSAASDDGSVTTLLPPNSIEALPHQALVRIKSTDGRTYLGVVVAGPFAEPDGMRADAPILVAVNVRGGLLLPKFHGRAQLALLSEELPGTPPSYVPPRRRPRPNSPVFVLTAEETATVLRTRGDIQLGVLESHEEIEVGINSHSKAVLPRHLGILGTTGGGKSTSVSGLVAQAEEAGIATILLDTEGEYTAINEPTVDPNMIRSLDRRGAHPAGVANTRVYHLAGRECANPNHPSKQPFSLRFSELSPHAFAEIIELTEAQHGRFFKAYDATKTALDRLRVFPSNASEREQLIELDELESGYPRMTLNHLYDMINVFESIVSKGSDPRLGSPEFHSQVDVLKQIAQATTKDSSAPSWRALMGKVGRVKRYNIFDTKAAPPIDYNQLLIPGQVSIIDLSDTDFPQVNNLVIAQILRGVQRQQDENYKAATARGDTPNRTMVIIEEAHEFLSAERIRQMPVLFQQVARIARRGRKRWLGLTFVTQLPQHLPDEVLGLINNWVMHKISDANVINRLRRSVGGIDESLWRTLPGLAPGQAVVSFSNHARPLLISVHATPCRLLMFE
jgi:DNA helicase HerA-like ATPase